MRSNCREDLSTFYLPINVLHLVAVVNSLMDKNTYDDTLKYIRQYRKMNEKFCLDEKFSAMISHLLFNKIASKTVCVTQTIKACR